MVGKVIRKKPEPLLTHEEDPILTMEEAGKVIGKGRGTMLRWCGMGCLPCVRFPNGTLGIRKSIMYGYLKAVTEPTKKLNGKG